MSLSGFRVFSQPPTAGFSISKNSYCLEEKVEITNTSTDSDTYIWDFCFDSFENPGSGITLGNYNDAVSSEGITVQYDQGNWYGFLLGRDNDKLLRLDFGTDLNNTLPTVVDLGSISGIVDGATEIRFANSMGNWHAFIITLTGNEIKRLDFGTSLANTPTGEALGNQGGWSTPRGLDVVWDGSRWVVIVSSFGNNKVTLIDFGIDITSASPTVVQVADNALFSGLYGVRLIQDATNWYALLSSFSNDKALLLAFGTDLLSEPNVDDLGLVDEPRGLSFVKDGPNYYGLVLTGGGLSKVSFGDQLDNLGNLNIEDLGDFGVIGNDFGISSVKDVPNWKVFSINQPLRTLSRIDFNDLCIDQNLTTSTDFEPTISYGNAGDKRMELWAFNSSGEVDSSAVLFDVTTDTAPIIDFSISSFCSTNPIDFTHTSDQTITTYTWDFGDGTGTSSEPDPSYQYMSPGTYTVRLTVESENGCGQFNEDDITIYSAPIADASIPAGPLCSNSSISFTNTSTFDPMSPTTWLWDFGDGNSSTQLESSHTYTNGGTYTLTLSATLPNCVDVFTAEVLIENGPAVDFDFNDSCGGADIQFMDLTVPGSSMITNWDWDFGDGNMSTDQNPIHSYMNRGQYDVSLTTTNELGCTTTIIHQVTDHYIPVPLFSNQLLCHNSESLFTDLSSVESANISSWSWDFGDGNSSIDQNPTNTYAQPGSYDISLKVTSNFGCEDSTQLSIEVLESPTAAFSYDLACTGSITQLTDLSLPPTSETITDWTWMINGQIFQDQNPSFQFSDPGEYSISLTTTGSNLCLATSTQMIQVYDPPNPLFIYSIPCEDDVVTLTDVSSYSGDVLSRVWMVGNEVLSSGDSVVSFTPQQAGEVAISLTLTTSGNCEQSFSDFAFVDSRPIADFSTNTSIGAYPLTVQFTDESEDAISFAWKFDSNEIQSTDEQPSYTFDSPGEYDVVLITENSTGCQDSTSQVVQVVEPDADPILNEIITRPENGELFIVLDITNNGSVTLDNSNLTLKINIGTTEIFEPFNQILYSQQQVNYQLNLKLGDTELNSIQFLCAELIYHDQVVSDNDSSNNYDCIGVDPNPIFFDPFPNPSTGFINFDIVVPMEGSISLTLIDSSGNVVYIESEVSVRQGQNTYSLDASFFNAGVYILQLEYNGIQDSFRVVLK